MAAEANGIYPHSADPRHAGRPPSPWLGRTQNKDGGLYEFHTIKRWRDGMPFITLHLFARGILLHAQPALLADEPANSTDPVLLSVVNNAPPARPI